VDVKVKSQDGSVIGLVAGGKRSCRKVARAEGGGPERTKSPSAAFAREPPDGARIDRRASRDFDPQDKASASCFGAVE